MKHSCQRASQNFFGDINRAKSPESVLQRVRLTKDIELLSVELNVYILYIRQRSKDFSKVYGLSLSVSLRPEKTNRKPYWLKLGIELREDLLAFVEIHVYWKVQKKLLIYTD